MPPYFSVEYSQGRRSSVAPSPRPTISSMIEKPTEIPSRWGIVRRKPKVSPEEASITLFGPGVSELTSVNSTSGINTDSEARGAWSREDRSEPIMLFAPWRAGRRR
ncbi:Uncharacterised protein [Bordetella pertussis]|nr:Uncharacterised protein [Bordetella pertussis]